MSKYSQPLCLKIARHSGSSTPCSTSHPAFVEEEEEEEGEEGHEAGDDAAEEAAFCFLQYTFSLVRM